MSSEGVIWDANHLSVLRLHEVELEGLEVLAVVADVADEYGSAVSILLDARGIRQLRLALQRYERKHKK